ncbi:hypothetical protein ECDEC2B_1280 [Escherichia coli DEC2B]|nr:hypothetical protein ECDEC1C_1135 [Escherichia coli DEC1C]EHU42123.1 hypothetical protein ECDEC2B_1280 [Escherichia coli DEC2B]EHU47780.1 hypothetical protein ECDEC2C_1169 [Escherichia coli DEC2C]EHU61338.1 hypothetical protein ECDEC2E_1193 [Escherichia coli DEC2E]
MRGAFCDGNKRKNKLPSIREFKKGLNIYSISSMISHP